ncbi:MAG: aminotransferase class V-fold PLP-dependent enzyme [Erysipelotrichaceae bacterium]|nr:aminotransferase class V-fold PLP-dependent enzyme [Erysipelotrichaceae bacterium]
MLDVESIRKDFPMLMEKREKPLVYFDNAATTLKPYCVLDAIKEYYCNYTANAHRGDYDLSYKVDTEYEKARNICANFIGAKKNEVVFTSGTTESANLVAFSYGLDFINEGDEIVLTEQEHASNTLPWFKIAKMKKAVIKFIPLENNKVTIENVKKTITNKTKILAICHASNTLGYVNDIKNITKEAHKVGAVVLVDAAQSVTFMKVDVKELDCDFLYFSGHKLCGPTGIGVLYGKQELLEKMTPFYEGGGMNIIYDKSMNVTYKSSPTKFEAGTPKIEAALGLTAAITYLEKIGLDDIHKYEIELKKYALKKLKELDNVEIYNEDSDSNLLIFNIKGVFPQDSASYFNKYGICVRGGNHCAKLVVGHYVPLNLRCSFSFYNTKEEIDYFVSIAKGGSDFLDAYF